MNTHKLHIGAGAVGDRMNGNYWDVTEGKMTVTVNNTEYIVVKKVNMKSLTAGKMYLVEYTQGESGYDVIQFNGIVIGTNNNDIKYKNVKEMYKDNNVKSLVAAEEKFSFENNPHLNITPSNGDTGSYFYIYEGRFVWGSSCNSLAFWELKEYNEEEHQAELAEKAEAERVEKVKRQMQIKQVQIERLQTELAELEASL